MVCDVRRRRKMRRRSRSEHPPHTPWSMWFSSAYSRQILDTGQSAQTFCATMTPIPSLGKKTSGETSWHFPRAIHSVFTFISLITNNPKDNGQQGEYLAVRKFVRI